jgi:hypothetical protein
MRIGQSAGICVALLLLSAAKPTTAATLTDLGNLPECDRWAAGDVGAALMGAGTNASIAQITVDDQFDPALGAEGFDLAVKGPNVTLRGGDANGLMYGLFEIAEQIADGKAQGAWATVAATLHSTRQKPFLAFRADNAFLHTNPDGPLFDVEMWDKYIDMLARNRFNVLDLHGQYDLASTGFPSLYPMVLHLPDYPNVGEATTQAKNLADMKAILAHADSRGVRVAFMNYSAGAKGLPKTDAADYTVKAVTAFLTELPDLFMLGFRIGESGQKTAFYEDSYLRAVAASPHPDVPLHTRTWGAKRDDLQTIGQLSKGGLNVEIKFNGEQLGLPYQALSGADYAPGGGRNPAYSYQDYLDLPQHYKIIWQIRADGTHRFWDWENTDFIRRTMRSAAWGDAIGYSVEPQIAYNPYLAADYFAQSADQAVYKYIWEKHWLWYMAWGRLGYDPDLPEQKFVDACERRFGPAGDEIYQAVQDASVIVPLVDAYRFQGPDQRDFSPETETGAGVGIPPTPKSNRPPTTRRARTPSTRPSRKAKRPLVAPLLRFGDNAPMDNRSFTSIADFVQDKISGQPSAGIGPARVAGILSTAADSARKHIDAVGTLSGRQADEWRLLRSDLLCATYLGDYYSNRIVGMTHLRYAVEAGSEPDYDKSQDYLAKSRDDWKQLADLADSVYSPLTDKLRHETAFRWSYAVGELAKLDATAEQIWSARKPLDSAGPLSFTPSELGKPTGIRVDRLTQTLGAGQVTISCAAGAPSGVMKVLLWHRELPSYADWVCTPMSMAADGSFSATVPVTAEGMLYQVELRDGSGQAALYPDALKETPYRSITPAELAARLPAVASSR